MSYFRKLDKTSRSNQLFKRNANKVLRTSYDNPNFKITHFTHILSLNSLVKRPKNAKIAKSRDFEPGLLENEALNQRS